MPWSELHYLPMAVFILLPATFIISYVVAILLGHVELVFPYISDTGTHVPESNFFAQMLNMVAALGKWDRRYRKCYYIFCFIRFYYILKWRSSSTFASSRWNSIIATT